MFCYQCKTENLKPTKLDFGLPALRCEKCAGTHLDLLTYRAWLEDMASDIEQDKANPDTVEIDELTNTEHALICQHCHKFMLKHRINHQHDNTINVCHTCYNVWLDKGEWELLKQLKIYDKLTEVMSEPWQKHIREQETQQAFDEHYQKMFGDDFGKIVDFANWLNQHPKASEIRHFLMSSGN